MKYHDEDESEDDFDDEDEDEEDFGETELDRNAGDYGPVAHGFVEVEDDPHTVPVDPAAPVRAPEPDASRHPHAPRAIAKTAPLMPAQRPPEVDDDHAPTALDREPMDPARPPRGHGPGAPRGPARVPDRLPAPPLPVPSSDLPLKLLLAALIAVIVLLLGALAFGVLTETGADHSDRALDGVRP